MPPKKRSPVPPVKPGKAHRYLMENFPLPADPSETMICRNGHVILYYIQNDKSFAKTAEWVSRQFGFRPTNHQIRNLAKKLMPKFWLMHRDAVRQEFEALCLDAFVLHYPPPETAPNPESTEPSPSSDAPSIDPVPSTPLAVPSTDPIPSTSSAAQLTSHLKTMEDVSDEFLCGQCQNKFTSLSHYIMHKVQHVETGKPGGCPLCGTSFSRQASLREHLHRKHAIARPQDDLKNNKPRGRPRKDLSTRDDLCDTTNASDLVSTEHADLIPSLPQQTMHIIIDKIGEESEAPLTSTSLSNAVLQADGSVVFPSSKSVVMVETSGDGDLQHLVNGVSTGAVNGVSEGAAAQNTHTVQADGKSDERNSLQCNQSIQQMKSSITADGVPQNTAATFPDNSDNPLPPQTSIEQHVADTNSAHSQAADPDPDFLFILLSSHMKRKSFHYTKQSFKCFHCDYKSSWRRSLVKHMSESHADNLAVHDLISVHKSDKLQDQQVMKMSDYTALLSRQRRQVNSHRIRGVERQDLSGCYPCSKCDKVFGRLRYLRKHQVIHKVEKKFLCDDCGKAFKTKAYLAAHRLTHQTKAYQCSQCDFSSTINALIHAHRQLHHDHSVICEVCGWAYNDRATLRKHKQVHDEARPYPCAYPGCTWRFKTEVMCRAHYRGHTTEGRFVCQWCSYVFRHKHHLQRHLARIHSVDPATVYKTTRGGNNTDQVKATSGSEVSEVKDLVEVVPDAPLSDTVSLIVNSSLSTEQLQSVLESGQFVIATDDQDTSVNYEVANITMNVAYDGLGEEGEVEEGQTILIPQDAQCSQIIFQQEADSVPATVET